jgi:Ca-activated chloride channel family protein
MKKYVILILMILSGSALFAQDAKTDIYNGNKLYDQKKFKEAELEYQKAAQKKKMPLESNFNMGDAMYKQKQFDGAAKNFNSIASSTTDPQIKAGAYHNLGNTMLENKKYDESIDAYKKALLNNPKDDATRYNLAYAQEMLKKQKQQNKNNQNNQNQNNQNNQNKNKNDKGNPDKKNQDQNKQNQNQDPGKQDPNKQDQQKQQQQPKDGISKDDAQRMLNALNNQEQGTQDKLKNKKLKGAGTRVLKDW